MNFEISYEFDTDPKTIFTAWLNSEKHSEMTGGEAITSNIEGKEFTAWDE